MNKSAIFSMLGIVLFFIAILPVATANNITTFNTKDLSIKDMGGGDACNDYYASDSATTLYPPVSGTGTIHFIYDKHDQYKVAVKAGDKVTINFAAPSGATGIDFPIYDTNKNKILVRHNVKTVCETVTASGDGYIYFTIDANTITDKGTYSLSVSVWSDTTPPTVTITNPRDGATVHSSDVTVSWTGSDDVGIEYYGVRMDGSCWIIDADATNYTFTGLSDGSHTVDVQARDAAGNIGGDSITFTVDSLRIDYTFTGSIRAKKDSTQHTFTVPSNATKVEVKLQMPSGTDYDLSVWDSQGARTGGWTSSDHSKKTSISNSHYSGYFANPEWVTVDPPTVFGTWKTSCYAYSGSGVYIITVAITLSDTTPPTVTITNPSDGATVHSSDVAVSWAGYDNVGIDHYEVRMDGGYWVNVGNAIRHTFTDLSDGSHTVDVKAYDAAGNTVTDSGVFTVDTSSNPVTYYALIVGVSDYKAIYDLFYADEDASDWYNFLTSTRGWSSSNIKVYGDGHSSNYPKWDGYATEYNVKQALTWLISTADANDVIAFISSGHGSGDENGASALCMWDCGSPEKGENGLLCDTELAAILKNAIANKIFVFLDHCYSGGFGDDLMGMPNKAHVYLTTTCTEKGHGYDYPRGRNGAWTYFFLEYSWVVHHYGGYVSVALESVFNDARNAYPRDGSDTPQQFDGDPNSRFYLE